MFFGTYSLLLDSIKDGKFCSSPLRLSGTHTFGERDGTESGPYPSPVGYQYNERAFS